MLDTDIITIENLNLYNGKLHILKNISLKIPAKKITVIIGPSGCGKTTLLKTLNRLHDLDREIKITGKVLLNGENIFDPKIEVTKLRRKIGLLSQRPCVLPMSIYENVAFVPRLDGIKNKSQLDKIVRFNLEEVGLWDEVADRLTEPAARLSVGQQQRLCLARGLAGEPLVILGDEPTSALDPKSSKKIEEKFLTLKRDYTIVIVTHILRQARRLADNIIFLYEGEVIEQGSADDFFNQPNAKLSQEYLNGFFS